MEIVHEMKIEATFIQKDAESGDLPFEAVSNGHLEEILKAKLDADDLHITSSKAFERDEEA